MLTTVPEQSSTQATGRRDAKRGGNDDDHVRSGYSGKERKLGTRDGLFQRAGWWWIDYTDSEGKRHRKKAAPDYDTAKKTYRATMTAIARGEMLGVREEGIRVRDFVEKRYWPTVKPTLSVWEQKRARCDPRHPDAYSLRRTQARRTPPRRD